MVASGDPNWFVHYRKKGGELEFAEVLRLDKSVFIRRGKKLTFGKSESQKLRTSLAAESAASDACSALLAEGFELKRSWVFRPDTFDFELLKTEVVSATRAHFKKLLAKKRPPNAFSLHTDGSAMTLVPVSHDFDSIADAEDDELWHPSEWTEWDDFGFFDIPYRLILSFRRDDLCKVPWDTFRPAFHETMIASLEELIEEGLFGTAKEREGFVLVYSVADSGYIDGAMKRLNVSSLNKRFGAWLKSWQ